MDGPGFVEQCRALGDPVRWAIVQELRGGTRCACELSQLTETAPTLLSYHLGILRDAGLITGARRGRWIDYTLVDGPLDELAGAMSAVREARR